MLMGADRFSTENGLIYRGLLGASLAKPCIFLSAAGSEPSVARFSDVLRL